METDDSWALFNTASLAMSASRQLFRPECLGVDKHAPKCSSAHVAFCLLYLGLGKLPVLPRWSLQQQRHLCDVTLSDARPFD